MKELNMDGTDAEAAVRGLVKGKYVDALFDLGEHIAAEYTMWKTDEGHDGEFALPKPLIEDQSHDGPAVDELAESRALAKRRQPQRALPFATLL